RRWGVQPGARQRAPLGVPRRSGYRVPGSRLGVPGPRRAGSGPGAGREADGPPGVLIGTERGVSPMGEPRGERPPIPAPRADVDALTPPSGGFVSPVAAAQLRRGEARARATPADAW